MEYRNLGIFAHVDAGKTTLSEQILLLTGKIREIGSVDRGTAHTDTLDVEKRRGISVKANCVRIIWKNCQINLIDTPGHTDFSAEIEESIWALDGAVLVVCGVEGLQLQTELLFDAFSRNGIPVVFFINKMDRPGADAGHVMDQIRRRLTRKAVFINQLDQVMEVTADEDDAIMEKYLEGSTIPEHELMSSFHRLARSGRVFPVRTGSALTGEGVQGLLDSVIEDLPAPSVSPTFSGVAFASVKDRVLGRGVVVRLFGGEMVSRQSIDLPGRFDPATGIRSHVSQKISQIRSVDGEDLGILRAGEIGVVYGLGHLPVGHIFGKTEDLPRQITPGAFRTPLLTVRLEPEKPEEMEKLRQAAMELSEEDPLLQATYSKSLGELRFHVMGTVQQEILEEEFLNRYGLKVRFMKPAVMYRETLSRETVGFCAYTMPKPCWAVLKFDMRPSPRGSGVHFSSIVPSRQILEGYQNQVRQALPLALKQGRLGWPVTDVDITLIDGNHHQFHTHPLDFIVATPWAIQDGLERGGTVLLEPILRIRFFLPGECVGRVMSDIAAMRGKAIDTQSDGERVVLTALVPLSTSMDYATTLSGVTRGKGGMSVQLDGYEECPLELGATCPRRGVDPLDTSRYILAARSALEGGIFDLD